MPKFSYNITLISLISVSALIFFLSDFDPFSILGSQEACLPLYVVSGIVHSLDIFVISKQRLIIEPSTKVTFEDAQKFLIFFLGNFRCLEIKGTFRSVLRCKCCPRIRSKRSLLWVAVAYPGVGILSAKRLRSVLRYISRVRTARKIYGVHCVLQMLQILETGLIYPTSKNFYLFTL